MKTTYTCASCKEEFIPGSFGFGGYECLIIDPYDDTEARKFHMCQSCRNNLIKTLVGEPQKNQFETSSDLASRYELIATNFRKCAEKYVESAKAYEEYADSLRHSST